MIISKFLEGFSEIKHGVFSPSEGVDEIKKYFKTERIALLNQTHTTKVFSVNQGNFADFPEADAALTDEKGIVLLIKTADCSPIIFYNKEEGKIAVTHAGWRGAVGGIISNTIEKIGNNAVAVVGPMIYGENYQVKEDLMANFEDKRFFYKKNADYYFNFPDFIEAKLIESGIKNYEFMGIDTYTHHNDLASYRYNTTHNIKKMERLYTAIMLEE